MVIQTLALNSIVKRYGVVKPKRIVPFSWTQEFHNGIVSAENKYKHLDILNNKMYYMLNQIRGKKNRKKRERVNLNAEQKAVKIKIPPIRLEDRTTICEPPTVISKNIKKEIMKVCIGKERTRRHFKFRNKYRIKKLLNMTHDKENIKDDEKAKKNPSTFITPLTKLQHESVLPRTLSHDRFNFPHNFHYSVLWHGSSTVDYEDNTICFFSSNINDLSLTPKEQKKIKEILGPERVDLKNDLIYMESNFFNTYNHNAAYLGDAIQFLMKRIKSL
ncbi:mitochondrial ribosomal protein S35 precursor, putative [Plasmodium chabaudi adami]|uniref:Mitochondrial ribosomal protein S35, putative n=2 Tax=Plasmodium chabaudi TaxID=5825 RepID=A0A1C6YRV6_PLACU|nr:mitochondrial ribosomal protein S35 precursor, putative [Plasmodium chabaudi adami]SCM25964.1 mitochondrial ribosomal protein S35 precursor, putative [Plasmodium chabaudi chabaudi]